MYRSWRGPIRGQVVGHAWHGYRLWVLFLELGNLTPSGFVRRDGSLGAPSGEWCLNTMESWPRWALRVAGREVANSEMIERRGGHALRFLTGRRLLDLAIDPATNATRLRFSRGVELVTMPQPRLYKTSHWELREPGPEKSNWPAVTLRSSDRIEYPLGAESSAE